MGKSWADLPAFRQGHAQGIYMNPSLQRYNVRYTEREGGKSKGEVKRVSASDRARSIICKERPVFRLKTGSVLCVKAQQRVRGQREQQWSKSDDKGNEKGS